MCICVEVPKPAGKNSTEKLLNNGDSFLVLNTKIYKAACASCHLSSLSYYGDWRQLNMQVPFCHAVVAQIHSTAILCGELMAKAIEHLVIVDKHLI